MSYFGDSEQTGLSRGLRVHFNQNYDKYCVNVYMGKIKKILKILIQVQPSFCFILPIDSGGNTSDLVFARNCCMARMLPREAELVSE